jgi:hypothetical protein
MNAPTTTLHLDSLGPDVDSARWRLGSRLHGLGGALGALVVTPLVLVALWALVFLFLSKLLIELGATLFER